MYIRFDVFFFFGGGQGYPEMYIQEAKTSSVSK